MVPISVTGVHNCLSNCFITGEEAWAPSALPPHLDFGKPSPAQTRSSLLSFNMYLLVAVISQERVISLYADSDSNAFNGNSHGVFGGGGALMAICWRWRSHLFCREWMWKDVKNTTCKWCQGRVVLQWSTGRFFLPLSECVFVCYPSHLYG